MAMRFMSVDDQEKLRARFERDLEGEVRLVLFVQPPTGLYIPGREEPQTGRETQQLLEEVAALSPKLHLEVHNPRTELDLARQYGVERTPALILLPGAADGDPETAPETGAPGDAPQPPAAETRGAQDGRDHGGGLVRFFGLPSGYEFATLMDDLVDVSRGRTLLSDATRQALAALPGPLHLQVFVTPT